MFSFDKIYSIKGVDLMLIDFELKNFLSFKDSTILSMETGRRLTKYSKENTFSKSKVSLLKNINIFGANGAGKSNLMTALNVLSKMILDPTKNIEEVLPYMPFKLDEDGNNEPTKFTIRFIKQEKIYVYHLEYNFTDIILEELYIGKTIGKEKLYFRRTKENKGEILPQKLKKIRESVRKNKLLLFDGQDQNDSECVNVFKWFHNDLIFESLNRKAQFKILRNDLNKKNLFLNLLNLSDFNIIDIEIIEKNKTLSDEAKSFMSMMTAEDGIQIPNQITSLEIYLIYKRYNSKGEVVGKSKIPYEMESSGTKRFMAILLMLLQNHNKDKVIVMDEFDNSFHFSLTKSLLQIINSPNNFNQFIFTTHNLNILDLDLRVDQIYLTEKDFLGVTELYSLFDFNGINGVSRSDIKFIKRYLNGLFGALPNIDFEKIQELYREIEW